MAICKYLGAGGITGVTGQWGAGLGRALGGLGGALGLGAAVDVATKAYTGYGLLETLSVPYIECPDGSFATAMEWYGSGLKCPKRPETTPQNPAQKSPTDAAQEYNFDIEALGGAVFPYIGYHGVALIGEQSSEFVKGHYSPTARQIDKTGNILTAGIIYEETGFGQVRGFGQDDKVNFTNYGWGGWGGLNIGEGFSFKMIRNSELARNHFDHYTKFGTIIGLRVVLPPELPFVPPAATIPPPRAFQPTEPPEKEDCEEMACKCLTPQDIENAVKKALGLKPFAPEKLIREIGAKMFVAPGSSLVPVVPKDLVEAIAAIQAASYMRAGYGRYPVLMPDSIVADDNPTDVIPTLPIENYAEWFEWYIKQFDAILGQFPIKIAIVDGAKRQPLKFENVSEALAEMTGLMVQVSADADAAVAVGSHAAVAATKAQCAAIVAQKNAECLIKFFGVRTAFSSIFVQSAITPQDSDNPNFNLKKFLTPSQQMVAFYTDNDPFDFQAVLDRILRNSEIAKSAVALDAKSGLVGDYAKNQRRYDTAEAKREAEKELDKLQAAINANNPEFKVKIRVDTAAPVGDVVGNNFVIKRPKTAQNE